jgi:hypothetical protein
LRIALLTLLVALIPALAACGSATVYLSGDFEAGDLSEWEEVQALEDRLEVVEEDDDGNGVGRFEVREGDEEPATGSQRAEVISGLEYEQGDIRYFRILTRVESWDDGHWGMIWQIHDDSLGSPPIALQVLGDDSGETLTLESGEGDDVYWETDLPENEWFEVVVRVEFGPEGSLEVWFDGEHQEMANGETSMDGVDTLGEPPGYDKLGIYRSHEATETAVVFHDGYRVTDELFSEPPG